MTSTAGALNVARRPFSFQGIDVELNACVMVSGPRVNESDVAPDGLTMTVARVLAAPLGDGRSAAYVAPRSMTMGGPQMHPGGMVGPTRQLPRKSSTSANSVARVVLIPPDFPSP